jgi:hypothetical protein
MAVSMQGHPAGGGRFVVERPSQAVQADHYRAEGKGGMEMKQWHKNLAAGLVVVGMAS